MATTTPNFGWPVPTSTDLVKDGATAIEALGDGIDTSLVDLKGGTTGQVLAKASSADMDFSWVAEDDSNAIQNSIVDAKGDLIAATANDTPARLAVGADGSTLVANSAAATGLSWAGQPYANPVLNSAFQVWQRGTSAITPTSNGGAYTADRWFVSRGSNTSVSVSRQVTGDTTNLPFIQYCARVQRTASSTTTSSVDFGQMLETINSIFYAGKTVTLSAYIRKGTNFSATSDAMTMQIVTGTGTDQKQMDGGYTGQATPVTGSITLTSTWQRFSVTGTIGATATEITPKFLYTPTGTAGADDWYEITGVQIDLGSVALPFRTYAGTIQGELAACQRYYEQSYASSPTDAENLITGYSDSNYLQGFSYTVQKRVAPTIVLYSSNGGTANRVRQISTNVNYTPAGISNIGVARTRVITGIAQSNMMDFHFTASAEL